MIVLLAQEAATPAGKPVGEPIPVAFVVLIVMLVKVVLIHKVGFEEGEPAEIGLAVIIAPDTLLVTEHPLLATQ